MIIPASHLKTAQRSQNRKPGIEIRALIELFMCLTTSLKSFCCFLFYSPPSISASIERQTASIFIIDNICQETLQ